MRRVTLVAAFLVLLAAPAWADFQAGIGAFNRGDYATALREWRSLADQGDALAQLYLGYMYTEGMGVEQDHVEAVKWFRKAAEQGDADAQSNLGLRYTTGEGVTEDYTEALKWFRKAGEQGDADAQVNLGVAYASGEGVEQDHAEAVKWYRLAAEQGHADAQVNLGVAYANGEGVAEDKTEAVKWYGLAAEQGHARAQFYLGYMYSKGEDVTEDDTEAVKWYRLAAEQGYARAQHNLGVRYATGEGVTEDYTEAVKWYRLAAEQEDTGAQSNLGSMYANGKGVAEDHTEAVKWYRLAAEQGDGIAMTNLGKMYQQGLGVTKDIDEAIKWLLRASDTGEVAAQLHLGSFSLIGIMKPPKKPIEYFKLAALNPVKSREYRDINLTAQVIYADLLDRGYGIEENKEEAVEWLTTAADGGDGLAQLKLAHRYALGRDINQNSRTARELFEKAAENGYKTPQYFQKIEAGEGKKFQALACEELWRDNRGRLRADSPAPRAPWLAREPDAGHWPIPVDVRFSADLIKLISINTKDQSFKAELNLEYEFDDVRFLFDQRNFETSVCSVPADVLWGSELGRNSIVWDPQLTVLNSGDVQNVRNPRLSIKSEGIVKYNTRLSGDFRADLDLGAFPFDIQKIDVSFVSPTFPIAQVRLVVNNEKDDEGTETSAGATEEWVILEQTLKDTIVKKDGQLYSQAILNLKIKRNPTYYIGKIIIPLFVLFLVSTAQFWFRWDRLDARVTVVVTALVAVIAYQLIIAGDLPKLSYLTMLDKIILTTFMMISLGVGEFVIVFWFVRRNKEMLAEKIDRHCCYAFPLTWVVIVGAISLMPIVNWYGAG